MPKIFDNIENYLLDSLKKTIGISHNEDFFVGYFNLRVWKYQQFWQGITVLLRRNWTSSSITT